MWFRTVISGLAAISLLWSVSALGSDEPPVAKIAQGRLVGVRTGEVEKFLNVPFAAAPVGPLRWRAPQAPGAWSGVRSATDFGPACPQMVRPAVVAGGVADRQSEDCLQLNIWRPVGAKKLPVMVWIHGGAHVIGSGTFPAFEGSAFARQGVILVTINYRLGPLGYFAHPSLTKGAPSNEALANYGLMDQISAIRWVQKNIKAFGGDPRQVTLFGESAGAISLTTILSQPKLKGLFARAIIQSSIPFFDPTPLAKQEALGRALTERAGAGPDATAEVLRALPVDGLIRASNVREVGSMSGPVLDGKLVREAPWRVLNRAEPNDVPLLIGSNSNEASVILGMGIPSEMAYQYLGQDLAAGKKAYGAGISDIELRRQVLGDAWFGAPSRWLAEKTSGGAPSYLYYFDYVAAGHRKDSAGAGHGSEIPYLFGTMDFFESQRNAVTDEDRIFAKAISACWVAFAKGGTPTCPLAPRWPRYVATKDELVRLSTETEIVAGFRKEQFDYLLKVHFSK